jgi:hypothetical protein
MTPDVLLVLFKGIAPSYSDYYQVMLDGSNGAVSFIDSLGAIDFASPNAADLDNDGRDEGIYSITYFEGGRFKSRIEAIDFATNTINTIDQTRTGVNIGSTPLITDMDNDGLLDVIYSVKKDSLNPMGWKGIYVYRHELTSVIPNAGVAWGSYIGNNKDGVYYSELHDCGSGSVISGVSGINPTCNGFSDGGINLGIVGGFAPYTYTWSTDDNTPSLNNLPADTFWVQVTNSLGCFENRTVILTDPFVITFGAISPPTCIADSNGTATLNSTGCYCMFSGCNFLWDNGITTKPNYALPEGWNSVVITHSNGCVVVDSVFIPSPPPVLDSISVGNVESCYGDQTGFALANYIQASLPVNFTWSNGEIVDNISAQPAGDYYLIAQDARLCRDSLAFTIAQPDSLEFTVTATNVNCYGNNDGTIAFSAIGGTGPMNYFYNGTGSLNSQVNGLGPDVYELYVQDQNGCNSVIQTVTISEPSALSILISGTAASGLTSLDGIAEVSVTGGTTPYTITWDDPNSQTGDMAVYLNPGWYTATVLDNNGCMIDESVYLGALGMEEISSNDLDFFPNPAKDLINLSKDVKEVKIYDLKGAIVKSEQFENGIMKLTISPGIYTMVLYGSTNSKRLRLVIVD